MTGSSVLTIYKRFGMLTGIRTLTIQSMKNMGLTSRGLSRYVTTVTKGGGRSGAIQ